MSEIKKVIDAQIQMERELAALREDIQHLQAPATGDNDRGAMEQVIEDLKLENASLEVMVEMAEDKRDDTKKELKRAHRDHLVLETIVGELLPTRVQAQDDALAKSHRLLEELISGQDEILKQKMNDVREKYDSLKAAHHQTQTHNHELGERIRRADEYNRRLGAELDMNKTFQSSSSAAPARPMVSSGAGREAHALPAIRLPTRTPITRSPPQPQVEASIASTSAANQASEETPIAAASMDDIAQSLSRQQLSRTAQRFGVHGRDISTTVSPTTPHRTQFSMPFVGSFRAPSSLASREVRPNNQSPERLGGPVAGSRRPLSQAMVFPEKAAKTRATDTPGAAAQQKYQQQQLQLQQQQQQLPQQEYREPSTPVSGPAPVSENPGFLAATTDNDSARSVLRSSAILHKQVHTILNSASPSWQELAPGSSGTKNKKKKGALAAATPSAAPTPPFWGDAFNPWGFKRDDTPACMTCRKNKVKAEYNGTGENKDMVACKRCLKDKSPCFRLLSEDEAITFGCPERTWVLLPVPVANRPGLGPGDPGYFLKGAGSA